MSEDVRAAKFSLTGKCFQRMTEKKKTSTEVSLVPTPKEITWLQNSNSFMWRHEAIEANFYFFPFFLLVISATYLSADAKSSDWNIFET